MAAGMRIVQAQLFSMLFFLKTEKGPQVLKIDEKAGSEGRLWRPFRGPTYGLKVTGAMLTIGLTTVLNMHLTPHEEDMNCK